MTKVTTGEVWNLIKYRSIFTLRGLGPSRPEALRESLGGRISFVVQGSQYIYTASPWTPRICTLRNFCNIEVYTQTGKSADRSAVLKMAGLAGGLEVDSKWFGIIAVNH